MSAERLTLVRGPAGRSRITLPGRAWLSVQGALLLLLAGSGFAQHFPGPAAVVLPLAAAVELHRWAALLVIAGTAIRLLYLGANHRWPHSLPRPGDLSLGSVGALRNGASGVLLRRSAIGPDEEPGPPGFPLRFLGAVFLLLLMPFQGVTGGLMWAGNLRPGSMGGFFDLGILGPAHTLGAYLALSFLLALACGGISTRNRGRMR